jgi:hypothetical protein
LARAGQRVCSWSNCLYGVSEYATDLCAATPWVIFPPSALKVPIQRHQVH